MTETVVFITGATGAIAKALIAEPKTRGAAKSYATPRDISGLTASDGLVPVKMDVTSDVDVAKAAAVAGDVTLLVNDSGINHNTPFMVAPDTTIAPEEIEVNYLAPLRVTRAFAPALISNKRAVLNFLTILARVNLPFMGSHCASESAGLSLTQGLRGELLSKGVEGRRCAARRHRNAHDDDVDHSEDDYRRCSPGNSQRFRGRQRGDLCRRDGARAGTRSRP